MNLLFYIPAFAVLVVPLLETDEGNLNPLVVAVVPKFPNGPPPNWKPIYM